MSKIKITEIIDEVMSAELTEGDAIYMLYGELTYGKDGCQPSGSTCLRIEVDPDDFIEDMTPDRDWVEQAIREYAEYNDYEIEETK